jgi:hypothetical protein
VLLWKVFQWTRPLEQQQNLTMQPLRPTRMPGHTRAFVLEQNVQNLKISFIFAIVHLLATLVNITFAAILSFFSFYFFHSVGSTAMRIAMQRVLEEDLHNLEENRNSAGYRQFGEITNEEVMMTRLEGLLLPNF